MGFLENYSTALCLVLAFCVYYNSLFAGFVYDDTRAVLKNPDVTNPAHRIWWNDYWGTPINSSNTHGSYRPLTVLTFRFNYWFFGSSPFSFHAVNVLLHCVSTYLVLILSRKLVPSPGDTLAAALFAAHPIHCDAVSSIVGRADLLSNAMSLTSFLRYVRYVDYRNRSADSCVSSKFEVFGTSGRGICKCVVFEYVHLATAVALSCAALLAKETGIAVYGMFVVYDVLKTASSPDPQKRYRFYRSMGILFVVLVTLLVFRFDVMGSNLPTFASSDNPTSKSKSLLTRTLTFLYLPIFNLFLLVFPHELSFDWSMDAIPRITTISDPRNLLTITFYLISSRFLIICCVEALGWNSSHLKHSASFTKGCANYSSQLKMCKYKLSSSPCKNNDKYSKLLEYKKKRRKNAYETYLICICLTVFPFIPASNAFFYVGFVVAERILYASSVGFCLLSAIAVEAFGRRSNAKLCWILSCILVAVHGLRTVQRNYDWYSDETLYRSAIHINPAKAYANLGSTLCSQGRLNEAEDALKIALQNRPNMADAYYNLGIIYQGKGDRERALQSYRSAIHFRPSMAVARLNLGLLLSELGRMEEAEKMLRSCWHSDGTAVKDPQTHHTATAAAAIHLGKMQFQRGAYREAAQTYQRVILERDPVYYHPQTVFNALGEALAKLESGIDAAKWHQSTTGAPSNIVPSYLMYGKLLAKNLTRVHEAEEWFLKAEKLDPQNPTVHHLFGNFLSDVNRHNEAAEHYLMAMQLAPHLYENVVNAATALRHASRNQQAEALYRKACLMKPNDAGAHINLGAILHLNGKFEEAGSHYSQAIKLDAGNSLATENIRRLTRHIVKSTGIKLNC